MIPARAIDLATTNGWKPNSATQSWQETAYDPLFWRAIAEAGGQKGSWWLAAAQVFHETILSGATTTDRYWDQHLPPS
jgi:hypothetical protein